MSKSQKKRNKKKRIRWGRILILLVGLLAILALCFFVLSFLFKMFFSKQDGSNTSSDTQSSQISDIKKSDLSEEMQNRVDAYMSTHTDLSEAEAIKCVKMNMDLEPYSQTTIIEDDSDVALLVNKFYALPEGYEPSDLVNVEQYACVQGEDYSCQTVDQIQLRQEAYTAYLEWCEAAAKKNINIRAIAGYRTYDYQKGLWDYAASTQGEEYADEYYARPGQSEHNTGLAVDITFNGYNFNEIENYEGYDWILENAHKYGFILRYPEDKIDITRYEYESWHFRYVGVDVATKCYENDWCLEEYYGEQ